MKKFKLLSPGQLFTVDKKVFRVMKCKNKKIHPCNLYEAKDLHTNKCIIKNLPNCGLFLYFKRVK